MDPEFFLASKVLLDLDEGAQGHSLVSLEESKGEMDPLLIYHAGVMSSTLPTYHLCLGELALSVNIRESGAGQAPYSL